jgi:hypothetical protein
MPGRGTLGAACNPTSGGCTDVAVPVQGLLPPAGHHRMRQRERLLRLHTGAHRTPRHARPPPLRGHHLSRGRAHRGVPAAGRRPRPATSVRAQGRPDASVARNAPPAVPVRCAARCGAQPAAERGSASTGTRQFAFAANACSTGGEEGKGHRARRPPPCLCHPGLPAVRILGSSMVKAGKARASTLGSTLHSSASTRRPDPLRTTSASARAPPPSCRAGELRHVHSRSTPAVGRP